MCRLDLNWIYRSFGMMFTALDLSCHGVILSFLFMQLPSVFTKHGSIQTIPSLTKRLKTVTDPVIGM